MKKISVLEYFDVASKEHHTFREFEGIIEAPNWFKEDSLLFNAEGQLYRYTISTDTVDKIDTGNLTKCNNDHVVSADGNTVGFSCNPYEEDGWVSQVYLMTLDGRQPRQITEISPSYLHGISHDNKELAYCAFRNDIVDIYKIPVSGGAETKLTDGIGYNDGPEYSPDDEHIWFNSTRSGLMQIFRMKKDGMDLQQMTNTDTNNWFPHLSPDGKKVVYLSFAKGDLEPWQHLPDKNVTLWLMDENGENCEKLLDLFGGQGTINVNSWSPDGKRFAFVSYRYK